MSLGEKASDDSREADMVAAPVNTMLEASNDPNVVANGYVREVYHPKIQENIKIHGSPDWICSSMALKFRSLRALSLSMRITG